MNYKGTILSGDLEENTVTIEMDKPIILKAGEYVVIPIEEFKQQIIDAYSQGSLDTYKKEPKNGQGNKYYNETFKNK